MQIHEFAFMFLIIGLLATLYLLPIILDLWGLSRPLPLGAEPKPNPNDTSSGCYSPEAIAFIMGHEVAPAELTISRK